MSANQPSATNDATAAASVSNLGATRGKVYLIGAGPGDPELLTIKALRILRKVDVVLIDRLAPQEILDLLSKSTSVIYVGKAPGKHTLTQGQINQVLVSLASSGKQVARVKGGDPFIFGRGGEELNVCVKAGIEVEVVPGVSSALAVPAVSGLGLTHREITHNLMITSGHEGISSEVAQSVKATKATLVVLMGVRTLPKSVKTLLDAGLHPNLPVTIIENGTLPQQRTTHTTVAKMYETAGRIGIKNPAVIVVGECANPSVLSNYLSLNYATNGT